MIQPLDRPKSSWFGLGLAVQFLLMIAVPAPAIYTQMTGQRVILKTIPVDPYDPLRGYSTTLRYDISDMQLLRTLPGWKDMPTIADPTTTYPQGKPVQSKLRILKPGTTFYLTLEPPSAPASRAQAYQPWKATAIHAQLPTSRSPASVILKGWVEASAFNSQFVTYGLETYYMPENRRNEVNESIRRQKTVAEIKVDAQGNGVPLKLRVGDQEFEF